jgi:hypothetical protein
LRFHFLRFLTRRGRIRRTRAPRRRAGSIPRPSPETRVRPVSTARSCLSSDCLMTVLICNSFDVSCSPPSPGRGCGVLCDPRAMAGTGTRARNESHQAHSRLLMSRTVDPPPVHATTPRGSSASSRGAQRDSHRDRRITGGAAAPATNTRSQQEDEIEPRSTSKHDQSRYRRAVVTLSDEATGPEADG